eukprot:TRINITY_DN10785_c0_g2_i2.p1 TRINITY_DN10785_c0_g2~~TRINITY_DN10785_c0_g2_i2.p1  ORF type:complete len:173 (+),score=14.05 TRINITY_DN10785_c0_g2_i2:81-599(+)
MQKVKQFRQKYSQHEGLYAEDASHRKRFKAKFNDRLSMTVICGIRCGNSNSKDDIVKDLHATLSPFVARVRGQCGLVQPIAAFTFSHAASVKKRQSDTKYQIDMLSVKSGTDHREKNFSNRNSSLKEAEALHRFLQDINSLTLSRGLIALDVPISKHEIDHVILYCLSLIHI